MLTLSSPALPLTRLRSNHFKSFILAFFDLRSSRQLSFTLLWIFQNSWLLVVLSVCLLTFELECDEWPQNAVMFVGIGSLKSLRYIEFEMTFFMLSYAVFFFFMVNQLVLSGFVMFRNWFIQWTLIDFAGWFWWRYLWLDPPITIFRHRISMTCPFF